MKPETFTNPWVVMGIVLVFLSLSLPVRVMLFAYEASIYQTMSCLFIFIVGGLFIGLSEEL